ncbi:NnrU family protein [Cohaesibacter celericrescens]|uniref:NnrU family protein n=1 Tax=Cohaesibacter celericrescens TaxID=2067669 RepID=UPI003566B53C
MTMLILGVLLWTVAHFFPVFMPNLRAGAISKVGEGPYKGLFTLVIVGALILIVFGWRSVGVGADLYSAPWTRHATYALVLASIILFGAAKGQSRIRKLVRHPMLTGVAVWAIGHLLVNNDPRSMVLFGGMLLWAVVSIFGINRRDGAYTAPEAWSWARDIRLVMISAVLYVALVFGHPYFTGIPLF